MRNLIWRIILWLVVSIVMVWTAESYGQSVDDVAHAIAKTEGFRVAGTLPSRLHNPGDIRSRLPHAYAGQVGLYHGYVVFKNDKFGWAALHAQIQRVIDGTSRQYDQSMTFGQIARVYAADPKWGKTVCKILKISPATTFQEYFEIAPRVRMTWNSNADILRNILATPAGSVALADTVTLSVQTGGGADAEI
jgi:hypothetical protein